MRRYQWSRLFTDQMFEQTKKDSNCIFRNEKHRLAIQENCLAVYRAPYTLCHTLRHVCHPYTLTAYGASEMQMASYPG